MQLTERHLFNTDAETYWTKIFFDREYNRRLYQDVLKFKGYEVLELQDRGGGAWIRKLRMEPGFDAPAAVKKVLGERLTYTETGELDPKTRRWRYVITTSVLADKISISGELWTETRGEKSIERFAQTNITVRVFGVGGILESYVEKEMRASYEKAARFTNEYIRERGL